MFVKITNGVNTHRVSEGAFDSFYKPQGYYKVNEELEEQEKFDRFINNDEEERNEELELLSTTPVSEMTKEQLKKYAKFLGVDLTGVKNTTQVRERIMLHLQDNE